MPSAAYGSIPTHSPIPADPSFVDDDAQLQTNTQLQTDAQLQADHPGHGTRTVVEVAFNIVNAIVGAGILGLPFALREAGFCGGLILSVWVGVLSHIALYMLVLSGKRAGIYKYADVAEHVLGKAGLHLTNFMLFFQSTGSIVGYFIIIGDTIPVVLGLYIPEIPILANRQFIIIAVSILFVLPLNFPRSIGSLAHWSIISVLLLPIILLTIILRAPVYASGHRVPLEWIGPNVFPAIGIMAFAFVCSQIAFMNYLSLRDQRLRTWGWTSALANTLAWAISMAFAVVGYLNFGEDVMPNLFLNFPQDDAVINIGRFCLGLSMILTIPMGFYPARSAVQKSLGFETATRSPTTLQYYTVTFVLFFVSLALGIIVTRLGKVYQVVGGFASTFLAYIFPGLAYLGVYHPKRMAFFTHRGAEAEPFVRLYEHEHDTEPTWWLDATAVVFVVFGMVVMVLATYGALVS